MTVFRVFVHDSSTGLVKAQLPYAGLQFNKALSGCGAGSFTVPIGHASVTEDNLGQHRTNSDREITVFRDDEVAINGPLTGTIGSLSSGAIQVTFREASYHLQKRVLEHNVNYDGVDLFDAVRDLTDDMTTKEGTGDDGMTLGDDIIAALPRWTVMSGTAGVTLTDASPPTFYGSARHYISDCFEALAGDPDTDGFEWKMAYSGTLQAVARQLVMGAPSLGITHTLELTERLLEDYSRTCDWERAATRVHVIGAGYTKTLQSSTAVSSGTLLSEKVDDASDMSKPNLIDARARDLRRLSRPAVRVFTAKFRPNPKGLAHDFCDLGDTVPFQISWPEILSINADTRRVVDIATEVGDDDGDEMVTLTFNDKLADLGD